MISQADPPSRPQALRVVAQQREFIDQRGARQSTLYE
jgi:hypothetical protein